MNTRRGSLVWAAVGVVGAVLATLLVPPGRAVVGAGPLRFDPGIALLAGFAVAAVYGVGSLVGSTATDGSG